MNVSWGSPSSVTNLYSRTSQLHRRFPIPNEQPSTKESGKAKGSPVVHTASLWILAIQPLQMYDNELVYHSQLLNGVIAGKERLRVCSVWPANDIRLRFVKIAVNGQI